MSRQGISLVCISNSLFGIGHYADVTTRYQFGMYIKVSV